MFNLSFKPYILIKKHSFRIAGGVRSSTPVVLIKIDFDGYSGYGEASMPPIYGESVRGAIKFLKCINLSKFKDPFDLEQILHTIDGIAPGNTAIKAAIDIALHDLIGKMIQLAIHSYYGLPSQDLVTSKTIGIDTPDIIFKRVKEAKSFQILKIKLGADNDEDIISTVRSSTQKPLFIDANQGWADKILALDKIQWLKDENVQLIEQPMPKDAYKDMEWLAAHSPLPIIGDEGLKRISDLQSASNYYHGVNIKLMKSTGLKEAYHMIVLAKAMGLRVMLGCMSETSCAIAAACQLGSLADWIDLDGNLGVTNDPYKAHEIENGMIRLNKEPGIGLKNPDWSNI